MTASNQVYCHRSVRAALALIAALAIACGGKKDDAAKGGGGEDKVAVPTGSAVTDSKSLQTGRTDWTKLDTTTQAPAKKAGEVKASDVPRAGIVDMTQVRGLSAMSGGQKPTGFRVAYAPTEKYRHFRDAFMQEQLFDKIAATLNATIKMPNVVDIQMVDCGTVNAFYDPNNSRIIMCYELLEYYVDMFKPVSSSNEELGNAVIGATFFAFFHELGHGLIHQLELASTGQEEDAVDELSTLILMEGGDDGVAAAMAGARWFAMEGEKEEKSGQRMPMWDEHGLNAKRFFNVACLVYGSNPQRYGAMVQNGYLPEPRAVRCPEEFKRKSLAWEKLLKDHIIEGDAGDSGYEAPPVQVPAADAPVPAPTPVEAPPAAGGDVQATCEALSKHILTILVTALLEQASKEGPDKRAAVEQELRASISIYFQQMVQACSADPPTAKDVDCVGRSQTVADLQACGLPL